VCIALPVAQSRRPAAVIISRLLYTQVRSATDITYTVEVSDDLQTWNSGTGYTTAPDATNNLDGVTQSVTVQAVAPVDSSNPKQFIRLAGHRTIAQKGRKLEKPDGDGAYCGQSQGHLPMSTATLNAPKFKRHLELFVSKIRCGGAICIGNFSLWLSYRAMIWQ